MKTQLRMLLIFILLIEIFPADSQISEVSSKPKHHSFIMYFNLPTVTTITSEKANLIGIGPHEWGFDFGLGLRLYRHINIAGEIGIGSFKDNNSFSNSTTLGEMESSFNSVHYFIEIGIWTAPVHLSKTRDLELAAGLNTGVGGFHGSREINNCSDCERESFSFQSSPFLEPELNFYFFQGYFGIGTSYRYYFSGGDLLNRITILKLLVKLDY